MSIPSVVSQMPKFVGATKVVIVSADLLHQISVSFMACTQAVVVLGRHSLSLMGPSLYTWGISLLTETHPRDALGHVSVSKVKEKAEHVSDSREHQLSHRINRQDKGQHVLHPMKWISYAKMYPTTPDLLHLVTTLYTHKTNKSPTLIGFVLNLLWAFKKTMLWYLIMDLSITIWDLRSIPNSKACSIGWSYVLVWLEEF